ncbi:MAG: hypothetical protein PWQ57_3278 [Desulfovibrionales bacterium]|nr:hypothetical protein [Desulfovibrionales bacterium]
MGMARGIFAVLMMLGLSSISCDAYPGVLDNIEGSVVVYHGKVYPVSCYDFGDKYDCNNFPTELYKTELDKFCFEPKFISTYLGYKEIIVVVNELRQYKVVTEGMLGFDIFDITLYRCPTY